MSLETFKFDRRRAEPGFTEEMVRASEVILDLLRGMTTHASKSALLNVVAMVLCESSKTETDAHGQARTFRRELDRAIDLNWPAVAEGREE